MQVKVKLNIKLIYNYLTFHENYNSFFYNTDMASYVVPMDLT